jgi:peptidoglycan hydrolase-like protein with peptidoglycan-binding domain/phosphodiesterase/alkaline phosphatase D-like protein
MKILSRALALVLTLGLFITPVAPAFAQLAGSVDTSGTTAPSVPAPAPTPVATPASVVTPPSAPVDTTPTVVTTAIPATPTTPTTPTPPTTIAPVIAPVTIATPSSSVSPVVTQVVAPIIPPADTTPPVISAVSSLSLEPTTATIVWTTDELATSALEYGTTQSYGSIVTLAVSASLAHDATMLNLAPNTTYYYCIHATDLAGNTSSSCGHTVTTAAQQVVLDTTPPAVSLVTVSAITTTSASVAWAADELAQGYVEYGTSDGYGSETPIETDFALSHTASLSGLTSNTTYHYRVHTHDASGNVMVTPDNTFTTSAPVVVPVPTTTEPVTVAPTLSTPSVTTTATESTPATSTVTGGTGTTVTTPAGSATVSTPADTTPPTISGVLEASIDSTAVSIGWTTNELATSTLVYGTSENYGMSAALPATAVLAHDATLTNLSPNTTYFYCIRATDLAGNTASSCPNSFTTASAPIIQDTTPPVILASVATSVATSSADIIWTTSEAADTQVEYGTATSYGSESSLNSTYALSGSIPLTSLTPDTTYHFRVRSYDAAGNLALGADQIFTTAALPMITPVSTPPVVVPISTPATTVTVPETTATVPAAPATITTPDLIISSVAADSVSESDATITWMTDLPSDSVVTYGDANEFDETAMTTTLTTSHSVTLMGLDPNTVYEFRVASAPVGVGAVQTVSGSYDFTTLTQPIVIDPPANILTVSSPNVASTGASVSFTTDEMTIGSVEYGLTTSYGETAADTSVQTSHAIDMSSLIPGTTYHFRVKAVDSAGNITYSIDHTFTTPGVAAEVTAPAVPVEATSTPSATATSTVTVSTPTTPVETIPTASVPTPSGPSTDTGIPAPAIVTVTLADSQVVFIVNPQDATTTVSTPTASTDTASTIVTTADTTNTGSTNGDTTVIVRSDTGSYPTSATDGTVIYDGTGSTFTDTNLTNGSTYDYTLYTQSSGGGYSSGVHISVMPVAGVEQVQLDQNTVVIPAAATQHFTTNLALGSTNPEVEHLQQILNTEGVHVSGLTTGYFGPLTESSLKKFQANYNLPQTGVTDAATRAVLNSVSQGWMVIGAPADLTALTSDLKQGDTNPSVGDLQEFLAYEGSYEEGTITNYYGPLTKESVADFQKKFGVTPVSGYVGPKTRHTIQTVLGQ